MFEGSVGSPFSGGNQQAAEEQVLCTQRDSGMLLVSHAVFVEVVLLAGTLQ